MRDKYGVSRDHYCYPDSDTLKNQLNIQDGDELHEAETAFAEYRYINYVSHLSTLEQFDVEHFRALHWVLFQDVYSWAGKYRDVDISKGTTRFCNCLYIEKELNRQLARIPQLRNCIDRAAFVHLIADIFCEINIVHPFREGNGRATRFFFEELVFVAGYELDWPEVSKDHWLEANIQGYHGNLSLLEELFDRAISQTKLL